MVHELDMTPSAGRSDARKPIHGQKHGPELPRSRSTQLIVCADRLTTSVGHTVDPMRPWALGPE